MNTQLISDFLGNLVNVHKKGNAVLFICTSENGLVGVHVFLDDKDMWSLADWGKGTTEQELVDYFLGSE